MEYTIIIYLKVVLVISYQINQFIKMAEFEGKMVHLVSQEGESAKMSELVKTMIDGMLLYCVFVSLYICFLLNEKVYNIIVWAESYVIIEQNV